MVAGAAAGVVVDMVLFPLDTLKTRLQSQRGFYNSGGYRGLYKGSMVVMLGSAPTSSLFFITYNGLVNELHANETKLPDPVIHLLAASCGEVVGASIRVPLEVVKQRKQISSKYTSNLDIVRMTLRREGVPGLYRGLLATMGRDLPFVAIQYPLWEIFKRYFTTDGRKVQPLEVAYCGALAGGIAAALTTPMDVIKTRIMLAEKESLDKLPKRFKAYPIFKEIWRSRGIKGIFAGLVPRVLWTTFGGFIFFGVYAEIKAILEVNDVSLNSQDVLATILSVTRTSTEENETENTKNGKNDATKKK